MAFKLVRIDQETIPGAYIDFVMFPESGYPFWHIRLKDGTDYKTTHPVTVICKDAAEENKA